MSSAKKLTQTTLPFLIKSKSGTKLPVPQPLSLKKRTRNTSESKDETQKKAKLENSSTLTKDKVCASHGEPEVSSSSEQTCSASTSKAKHTLDPFIVLNRCDARKSEVSSSTSSDEVTMIDEISETVDAHTTGGECDDIEIVAVKRHNVADAQSDSHGSAPASPSSELLSSQVDSETSSLTKNVIISSNSSPSCLISEKTPKSITKNLTASQKKRREQQQLIMEEKKKKREEEREQKRLQKLEEKRQKEVELEEKKRLKAEQKEAERLAKLKEKEELQKQKEALKAEKQAEIDAKNALKEAKRQKKEEERKQKELDRLLAEEKARKLDVQKNALMKFFQKPLKQTVPVEDTDSVKTGSSKFKPFSVNSDMKLAPISRVAPIDKIVFDNLVSQQDMVSHSYLSELKQNGARSSPSTWIEEPDEVVELLPVHQRHKPKLLQFHTDVRPAYFGTWRKKSKFIGARRPLAQDKERFDYEVDSADEWEEEEPGESVDSGDEEEEKDEFDFDPELRADGFLVDHNYLSDDEGANSGEENDESLAAKKTKQMIARTYGKRNRRKAKIKPVVYGTVWESEPLSELQTRSKAILDQFAAIIFASTPIEFAPIEKPPSPVSSEPLSGATPKMQPQPVPDAAIPDLIKAIHGCWKNSGSIVKHFQEFWLEKHSIKLSKKQLKLTIQSLASYMKKPTVYRKRCWYVYDEVLQKHLITDLPVPNPLYHQPESTENQTSTPDLSAGNHILVAPNSSQKRLTDFIHPLSKKQKIEYKSAGDGISQEKGVDAMVVHDSPIVDLATSPLASGLSNTPQTTPKLKKGVVSRKVSFTTLKTKATSDTLNEKRDETPEKNVPSSSLSPILTPNSPAQSTKQVPLISLSSSTKVADTPPINLSEHKAPQLKENASLPRRISLTTLTASNAPPISQGSCSTNLQPIKSPRRIQLTTLPRTDSVTSATGNPLTERSQNDKN